MSMYWWMEAALDRDDYWGSSTLGISEEAMEVMFWVLLRKVKDLEVSLPETLRGLFLVFMCNYTLRLVYISVIPYYLYDMI